MVDNLMGMAKSRKPIVMLSRGFSMGISFTLQAHATFLYCTPDSRWMTPFMASCQSPEGTSTMLFPQIMGERFAMELLLTDKWMNAQEAKRVGWVNAILEDIDPNSDEINPDKIPVIKTLLNTDYRTLVNGMEQINASKDMARIEEITKREANALCESWEDEEFPRKMMGYMMSLKKNKKPRAKM
jgi:peroxisomal 3,2-trans-enoyl-CoA isomerase